MRYIGRHAQMDTPLKSRPGSRPIPTLEARHRAAILGSLTVPGRAEEVSAARAFIARTLAATGKGRRVDSDAATLLTSELVTNAIKASRSVATAARCLNWKMGGKDERMNSDRRQTDA